MRAGSKLACRWQIGHRIAGSPKPSAPRSTGGWCKRPKSPWRGRSPAGWQLTQRGCASTLPSSVNNAAERCGRAEIEEKLSGDASPFDALSEAPCAAHTTTTMPIRVATATGKRTVIWENPASVGPLHQVALRVGEDRGA